MLHLLIFIIIVHYRSDLYSIRRRMISDLLFVGGRSSAHRRFLMSLELSVVSFFLGKTKVEKIRICGNYASLFPGPGECL